RCPRSPRSASASSRSACRSISSPHAAAAHPTTRRPMAEPAGPNAARGADPDAHLARVRGLDHALVAHAARARRRHRLGAVLGALALGAGAALAALGAAAVIASPLSWIAAGASALTGLGALTAARAAARREA